MRELVKDLLVKSAREQRASNGAKLATDSMRVGRVSYVRSGMSVNEYWERGAMWHKCSKVFSIVTLRNEFARALTFANFRSGTSSSCDASSLIRKRKH
jgi:hypothetical protein